MTSYGGRYNATQSTLNLTALGTTQIPLPASMPSKDVTYTPANSITVANAGTYEINYFVNPSLSAATTLTFAVRLNGDNIPSATFSRLLSVGVSSPFSGSLIITLPAGSVIDMALSALIALGVTLGGGVNATLTIKQLT